jgi:hypothetical protein
MTEQPRNKGGRPKSETWTLSMLAMLVGVRSPQMGRWLSGQRYPDLKALQRIEKIFEWPVREQVDLIPHEGYDTRYGMVLWQHISDWMLDHPEIPPATEVRSEAGHSGRKNRPTKCDEDHTRKA